MIFKRQLYFAILTLFVFMSEAFSLEWQLSNEVIIRYSQSNVEQQTLMNRNNRFAQVPTKSYGMEYRPDLKFSSDDFSFIVKPRFNGEKNVIELGGQEDVRITESEWRIQEAKVRYMATDSAEFVVGRYGFDFGNTLFYTASNPFVLNDGRTLPKQEPFSRDFIELNYVIDYESSIRFIHNYSGGLEPIYKNHSHEFSPITAIMYEVFEQGHSFSALISSSNDGFSNASFSMQSNVSDENLFWFDVGYYNHRRVYFPLEQEESALGWSMDYRFRNEKNSFYTLVSGLSHSFEEGTTLGFELIHNSLGYDDDDVDRLGSALLQALNNLPSDESVRLIRRSLSVGIPYVRKNYAGIQLMRRDINDAFHYNIRGLYSMDDKSTRLSFLIEWDINDNWQSYLFLVENSGSTLASLAEIIDDKATIGFSYKF